MQSSIWRKAIARMFAKGKQGRRQARGLAARKSLRLEQFEDRIVPAVSVFQEGVDNGFGPYVGTQDVRISEDFPNGEADPGFNPQLFTDFPGSSGLFSQVLLRFDNIIGTDPGQIPPNAIVTSAVLNTTTNGGSADGDGGSFHRAFESLVWDESATFNSVGGFGLVPGFDGRSSWEAQAGFFSTEPDVEFGPTPIDVTEDVQVWVSGEEPNNGWFTFPWENGFVPGNGDNAWSFVSSEDNVISERPELRVEWFLPDTNTQQITFDRGLDLGIAEAQPNSPVGVNSPSLSVVSAPNATTQALLRFDDLIGNNPGQIPANANILGARLVINTAGTLFDLSEFNLAQGGSGAQIHRLLTPFDGNSSWSSFGGNGIQADGIEATVNPDDEVGFSRTSVQLAPGQNVYADVTESVRAWADGAPNHGLAILPFSSGGDNWVLNTLNSGNGPVLEVTYSTVVDPARVIVTQLGTNTNEDDGSVEVVVQLDAAPTADVIVPVVSSDPSEGTPSTSELVFTPANFSLPQTVTINGVDDDFVDGNVPYQIEFGPTLSDDPAYEFRTAAINLTNDDNDTTGRVRVLFQEGVDNGFGVYTGTLDTHIDLDNPDTALGENAELLTDFSGSSGLESQTLIRFENIFGDGQGQIPADAVITSASLSFRTTTGAGNGDGGTVHRVLIDWDESSTWNSLGEGIQADDIEARSELSAQVGASTLNNDPDDLSLVTMDVTRDLTAWQAGAPLLGWSLLPWAGGSNAWIFFSSEGALEDRPILSVEYVIPPPVVTVFDFQQGVNGYQGTQDTDLLQGSPDSDQSNDTTPIVDFAGPTFSNLLLRFDDIIGDGPGQIPVGSTVLSAELILDTINPGDGGSFHRMLIDWDESSTWNSLGNGVQADNLEALAEFNAQAGTPELTPNVEQQFSFFDVTTDVQAWVDGQDNFGFVFLPWAGGSDGWEIFSSEFIDVAARPRLRVTLSNQPPAPGADLVVVQQDSGENMLDVLANDDDPDGDGLTVVAVDPIGTSELVSITPDGTGVLFTPATGFVGEDQFTYTVQDPSGTTSVATVRVFVNATGNQVPVAVDDMVMVSEDVEIDLNVLANDSDADNDTLTIDSISQPSNGTAVLSNGMIRYTPNANFNGQETLTYLVRDPNGGVASATVMIDVVPVNDDPVVTDDTLLSQGTLVRTLDVLANDSDVDGDALSISEVTQPAAGTVTNNGDSLTYDASGAEGTQSFTYTVVDGNGGMTTGNVTVVIGGPIGRFAAQDDDVVVGADGVLTFDPLANDPRYIAEGANIRVVQFNSSNDQGAVSEFADQASPLFIIEDGNRGDIDPQIGNERGDDGQLGVFISTTAENGRDNSSGGSPPGVNFAVPSAVGTGTVFLPMEAVVGSPVGGGAEVNLNPSVSYFPFEDGWLAGRFVGVLSQASPGIEQGTEFIDNGDGTYLVDLASFGVTSQTDGVLLAISGDNDDRYAQTVANPDGTWTIRITGASATVGATLPGNLSFVYVPRTTPNAFVGIFDGNGTIPTIFQDEAVMVSPTGNPGEFLLEIDGFTPEDGILTLTPGGTGAAQDNVVSYEPTANGWIIQTRDRSSGAAVLEDIGSDIVTSFVFLPLDIDSEKSVTEINGTLVTAGTPVTLPSGALVTVGEDGTISYDPNDAFSFLGAGSIAEDSFAYTASSDGLTSISTVFVIVEGINDAPTAGDDTFEVAIDSPAQALNVLTNDLDVDLTVPVTEAANIEVTQSSSSFNAVTTPQGTPAFQVSSLGTGSFGLQIGTSAANDARTGVVIPTVRENQRDNTVPPNSGGPGLSYATSHIGTSGSPTFGALSAERAGLGGYVLNSRATSGGDAPSGSAFNINLSAAYFRFDQFIGGHATNDANGNNAPVSEFVGTEGLAFEEEFTELGGGRYQLDLTGSEFGVNSQTDGVLLVTGGKSGDDNYALQQANSDGTWAIFVKDNGDFAANESTEQDPPAFVFVPLDTPNATVGKFDGAGNALLGDGYFVERIDVGTYRLSIPVQSATTGALLLSPEWLGGTENVDNIVTYSASENDFIIQSRDADTGTLQELGAGVPVASFVFLPFGGPDQDQLIISEVSDPANGTVAITGNGTGLTYEPDAGFEGVDTFTYTVSDGNGGSQQGMVTVNVTDQGNNPPVANDDMAMTMEEVPVTINVLANDTDPDMDMLQVIEATDPVNGTVEVLDNSQVNYIPDVDFSGTDTFGYTVSDGTAQSSAVVTVVVEGVNDAPMAGNDNAETTDSTSVIIEVLSNDSDVDGDDLTIEAISAAVNGTVVDNGDGTITYTPNDSFFGVDTFEYVIGDGNGATATATVTVEVVGLTPIGVVSLGPDSASIDPDSSVEIDVLANDTAVVVDQGNINVVQNDTANNATSVTLSFDGATPGFVIAGGNRGDYDIQIGGNRADDIANGILISSVRQNGVDHGQGQGFQTGTSAVAQGGSGYFIPLHDSPGGGEFNINVGASYFGFAQGWIAGQALNSSNNAPITSLNATPGLDLGEEFIDNGSGFYTIDLSGFGISSQTDGVLQVVGGKNEDNYALVTANDDGTWTIQVKDNGDNDTGSEADPAAFVYVPNTAPGVVNGRFAGNGTIDFQSGDFTLTVIDSGRYQLTIDGFTPTDGVLLVSPETGGTLNQDNIVTYEPNQVGTGWIIEVRDIPDPGGPEDTGAELAATFSFIPFEAPGGIPTITQIEGQDIVVGTPVDLSSGAQVTLTADGTLVYNPNGAFSELAAGIELADSFAYTVTAGNLVNTSIVNIQITGSNDAPEAVNDVVTVQPDTTSEIDVLVNDSDVDQLVPVAGLNLDVVQNDTGNSTSSVTVTRPEGSPNGLLRPGSNRGDYNVQFGFSEFDDAENGILITTVRQNGVDHGQGQGFQTGMSSIEVSSGRYFIPVHDSSSNRSEFNIDIAAGYFAFDQGWLTGHARVSSNGGPITSFNASEGLVLNPGTGEFGLTDNGNGVFSLTLPGVDATGDGVLLVNGGKNEGNFALQSANADGSWTIYSHDNGTDGSRFEQDPVAFAFVPTGAPGVVSGKFDGEGNVVETFRSGDYTLTREDLGTYRLSIAGFTPNDGVLLLSPEGVAEAKNIDNIVSYEPDGDDFIIQTRDITGSGTELEDLGSELVASFAFIPFTVPDTPRIVELTQPSNGSVSISADGTSVSYTPNGSFTGVDSFTYTIEDSEGVRSSASVEVTVEGTPTTLQVSSLTPTRSGLVVEFSGAIAVEGLNLYEAGSLGAADLVLTGPDGQEVAGSLIPNAAGTSFTFVATGGPLVAGDYSLTLVSAENAFVGTDGELLDGDGDGTAGGDYVESFSVSAPTGVMVSLPDFARGPAQDVEVPNTADGLPLTLSDANGVTSVTLEIVYDPALLDIRGASTADGLPAGAQVSVDTTNPGVAIVTFSSPTALTGTDLSIINLTASVPSGASQGVSQVVAITEVSINNGSIAGGGDDAVHTAAFFGDVNNDGSLNVSDVTETLQVAAGTDAGFAGLALVDPTLVGDVDGDGSLTVGDVSILLAAAAGQNVPEIPLIP